MQVEELVNHNKRSLESDSRPHFYYNVKETILNLFMQYKIMVRLLDQKFEHKISYSEKSSPEACHIALVRHSNL